MTQLPDQPRNLPASLIAMVGKALLPLLAIACFLAGWLWLFGQHQLLWQRLPASTVERFIADGIASPLPPQLPVAELQAACARQPGLAARWLKRVQRAELAHCLATPADLVQGAAAERAIGQYQNQIAQQIEIANAWIIAWDAQSPARRAALLAELMQIQAPDHSALPVWLPAAWRQSWQQSTRPSLHTPIRASAPGAAVHNIAQRLRTQVQATQNRLQQINTLPKPHQARELALLATGLQLDSDYGNLLDADTPEHGPATHLASARGQLADTLEWQRRAQSYQQRGFSLTRLAALPASLFASSLVLLLAVALASRVWRGHAAALLCWSAATVLLACGQLVLTDLALTGEPALRYLAERQYQSFGLGQHWLNLTTPPIWHGVVFWWPLLLLAVGLLWLACLRNGTGRLSAPLRAWVSWSADLRWGALQSALLLMLGIMALLLLGMAAAMSEWLILLGCIGVASYLARQAAHANLGAGLEMNNLLVVASAFLLSIGGALARGDLGHALVALALALCFCWLFGWRWLRFTVLLAVLLAAGCLAQALLANHAVGPLAWLLDVLPPHAQDRINAMFDPWHADSSDLARIRWIMSSSGATGWGSGYAPWQGLSASGLQDGLPLQGPSDYVLALVVTLWGRNGGLLLMALVLLLFGLASGLGLRRALQAGTPPPLRLLTALGGFGCMVMAVKVLLSVGGVSGVLPLTGLPVSLLGYGPVTLWMALLYLALALCGQHVSEPESLRGVHLTNSPGQPQATGAVRRRALVLLLLAGGGLGLFFALAYGRLLPRTAAGSLAEIQANGQTNTQAELELAASGQRHVAQQRLQLAQAVANALVPTGQRLPPSPNPACPHLNNAIRAWDQQLASLSQMVRLPAAAGSNASTGAAAIAVASLQLDGARLLAQNPANTAHACRQLARTLGHMLENDLPRIVGRSQHGSTVNPVSTASTPTAPALPAIPRRLAADSSDYSTHNAWWGIPGCIFPATAPGQCGQTGDAGSTVLPTSGPAPEPASAHAKPWHEWQAELVQNNWFGRDLIPQLGLALRTPHAISQINGHQVATGPALGLTLDQSLQQQAQLLADCFTAHADASQCDALLPRDAGWRRRYAEGDKRYLRAGALGLVLAEVDSGRILAMAGAISDCSLFNLTRAATPEPNAPQRIPALRPNTPGTPGTTISPCAQLPDQRSGFLAQQQPALWLVPPGSSLKPLALIAGMDAQGLGQQGDAYWKGILAESRERLPIQQTALAAGQHYLDVLQGAGFAHGERELLWGSGRFLGAAWRNLAYSGNQALRASQMSLTEAEQMREQKLAGVNIDQRYGRKAVQEFLAARQVADASVGGGDIRINALGLLDVWRGIDLRARGQAHIPALHLLEQAQRAIAARPLDWASTQAASRALGMSSGVTASAWRGTAQGSCRLVFERCPVQGLAGVSGKTGSADFLTEEDGPYVKSGLQIPAKLFAAVFTGADGKRYAISAMALRVRETAHGGSNSRTLELHSSSPAEAALLIMRKMGVNVTEK